MIAGLALSLALAVAPAPEDLLEQGVAAYRAGDHDLAIALWEEGLDAALPDGDRARVCYNLGNAAWRAGQGGRALGWYEAALRLAPRHADARSNAAFVREELDIPPAETGDLRSAASRFLRIVTHAEAAWLLLLSSALLLAALVCEALWGGRAWRRAVGAASVSVVILALPWVYAETQIHARPYLVIGAPSVSLRAEPRPELPTIAAPLTGSEVVRLDELDGWLRVEARGGERGWAPAEGLFLLVR